MLNTAPKLGFILHNAQTDLACHRHGTPQGGLNPHDSENTCPTGNSSDWLIRQMENLILDEM